MGFSPSAELVFGFLIEAVDPDTFQPTIWADPTGGDRFRDIEELVLAQRGVFSPYLDVPEAIRNGPAVEFDDWAAINDPHMEDKLDAWRTAKLEVREECPVKIVGFGHHADDEPKAIVAPKGVPIFRGDAWRPCAIPSLPIVWEGRTEAQQFIESLGIEWIEPSWLLVASYG